MAGLSWQSKLMFCPEWRTTLLMTHFVCDPKQQGLSRSAPELRATL